MLLNEFRNEMRERSALPLSNPLHITSQAFPLVMTAAENKWGIENGGIYVNQTSEFYSYLRDKVSIFGGFFGWANTKGEAFAIGYACHESFRYWFTPDQMEAENTMAHISTSEGSVEEMMDHITNPLHKTKRMVRGILTFCNAVNENPYWHEEILIYFYKDYLRSTGQKHPGELRTFEPAKEDLVRFLNDEMPTRHPVVNYARPYGYLSDDIKTTNQYAMSERELIKTPELHEFARMFRPKRMMYDRGEADTSYNANCKLSLADFKNSLRKIGY